MCCSEEIPAEAELELGCTVRQYQFGPQGGVVVSVSFLRLYFELI